MPYTPPSSRSPATSISTSPLDTPKRPQLPRSNSSTTYLSRQRRSPSLPDSTSDHGKTTIVTPGDYHSSVRQSPPPVTNHIMPAGAIISPPDSLHNSDDSDSSPGEGRDETRLQELHDAVRRSFDSGSPNHASKDTTIASSRNPKFQLDLPTRETETSSQDRQPPPTPPKFSTGARKISHSRSATEDSFFDTQAAQSTGVSQAASDVSDEEYDGRKPHLLRKKSGELVKPAMRRKHSSMPGTPTYNKAVHFKDDMEQVRHFLSVDRPIAVSAGGSPADAYEDEKEFPFGIQASRSVEWELKLRNFPRDSLERISKPLRVERLYLSPDQKNLLGTVVVANLAFHKQVTARFTLDYWRTTSEVAGEFNNDPMSKPRNDGYDQFNFAIKLSDQANLEARTLLLCVRYSCSGQEYWDNNDNMNYQVDFAKRDKPADATQMSTAPLPGPQAIPRSRHNSSASRIRPRSMPSFEDDFSSGFDGDSIIKFRNDLASRAVGGPKREVPGGPQFSARYDFGASLTAALSQAQKQQNDETSASAKKARATKKIAEQADSPKEPPTSTLSARTGVTAPSSSQIPTPKPDILLADKQNMDAKAYHDFISKFCFAGTSKPTNQEQKSTDSPRGSNDGAQDEKSSKGKMTNAPPDGGFPTYETGYHGYLSPPASNSPAGSGSISPVPGISGYRYAFPDTHSGMITPTAIHG